jgi:hypothetical protein
MDTRQLPKGKKAMACLVLVYCAKTSSGNQSLGCLLVARQLGIGVCLALDRGVMAQSLGGSVVRVPNLGEKSSTSTIDPRSICWEPI